MGWIMCVHCKKLQRDFVARTFVLIAPFHYVLHQLSCTYETIPNAPKFYEAHWNISLGYNGVDWVRSLQKIQMWHRGTKFFINCTYTVCFATSFMQLRNEPKCTQVLQNVAKHWYTVQWGGLVAFIAKNPNVTSWHELLYELNQFSMFCNKFHAVTKRSQMHPKTTKQTESLV